MTKQWSHNQLKKITTEDTEGTEKTEFKENIKKPSVNSVSSVVQNNRFE
jgi:hypothetical protein